MEQSILTSTKQILGIGPDDDSFDLDVLTHVNSAFSTLNDLGVGPADGFFIEDEESVWEDFIEGDPAQLAKVKTFVYLSVRLIFDPPATSYVQASLEKQIEECAWRLSVKRENTDWTDPDPHSATDRVLIDNDPISPHFTEG
jgi:hypothetical protein